MAIYVRLEARPQCRQKRIALLPGQVFAFRHRLQYRCSYRLANFR
jgi:hypothetical protein